MAIGVLSFKLDRCQLVRPFNARDKRPWFAATTLASYLRLAGRNGLTKYGHERPSSCLQGPLALRQRQGAHYQNPNDLINGAAARERAFSTLTEVCVLVLG
jgi:hypothetical protein